MKTGKFTYGNSVIFYATASELILESDRQMKTSFDDSERILEVLILRLAQEVSHG